ncbi:hypothetical protein I6I32_04050 [Streptococcus oralis]|uniref:hypothetical protein n=2 Tax=Streptococcus oralis TaxID=1303 RepID=UPI0018E14FAB|nr:hypothetical protein [Streptococcus oralis]QQC01000.1 hypothetical protein I6I32_04050 [Streptococcus oralis]
MKDFVQASKKSFLYHGMILASLVGEVVMLWQLERVMPVLYPGFVGFLFFHLVYHIILFVIAKRSCRLDYLVTWGLFLMFNLLYDSFIALIFLGLSFGM